MSVADAPTLTFPQWLLRHAEQRPQATALREKSLGIWQTTSWSALRDQVAAIAWGLQAAGLQPGGHLLVIGENRPRLYAAWLAAQVLGAVPVPLYQDAAAAEWLGLVQLTEATHAVVEDQEQFDKLVGLRARCPRLQRLWVDDPRGLGPYPAPGVEPLDALLARGHTGLPPGWLAARVGERSADEGAALFFTSGTTGEPKGVAHTHRALVDRALAGQRLDRLSPQDEVLAYLPMAWIGQTMFSFAQWLCVGYVVNFPESPSTVAADLREIGPSYYFAPPRQFEALRTAVSLRMEDAAWPLRWLYARCLEGAQHIGPRRLAGAPLRWTERLRYALGDRLIYAPLRNALGLSRVRVAYTAGEAIAPALFGFFRAIGVNLKQLYGSTETAVFVCAQPDHAVTADSVGPPMAGVALRVDEAGELWVRSPGLFQGYHRNPAATAEVLSADGWYRTGDAGFLDASGQLKIIDRAKDVGRLADGSLFAPKHIENRLKFSPYIEEAVALGQGRAQVVALLNFDLEAVSHWAERRGLAHAGYRDLAGRPELLALMRDCVEQVNAELARDAQLAGCQIARFLVLPKALDADDGELTRTRKLRRGAIAERYAVLIDALFGGRTVQRIEIPVSFDDGRRGVLAADLPIVDCQRWPAPRAVA